MSTRAIRTSIAQSACDVCGRTLLRGERAQIYLSGGTRRSVCELCTSRALHGGWVREGTVPEYDDSNARVDRRRSLLSRFRGRQDVGADAEPAGEAPDEPSAQPAAPARADQGSRSDSRPAAGGREPRHVRAVPTSIEHKISSAVSLFNSSEHPRTVAGIARSLGPPEVAVYPSDAGPSVVNLVVSWELCWYRYEVDLSDEVPSVRVSGQGYELDELSPVERQINAGVDDRGQLELAAT